MKYISKIIISFIISSISLFFIYFFEKPKENGSNIFITIGILFLLIFIFLFNSTIKKSEHKLNMLINVSLIIFSIIYSVIVFDMYWLIFIGILFMLFIPLLINRYKILMFLVVLVIYPLVVVQTFKINMNILWIWGLYCLIALSYSIYMRNRKTKIYLYDNY